jgi:large subunit ribosomal protein L25
MALVERSHETVLLQAPVSELKEAMRHVDGHGALELQIGGESGSRKAIVKHVEQDALRRELIHVTLQEVSDDDQVKIDLPVVLRGQAADDGQGVTVTQTLDHVKVRGRLRDIPDHLEVDISDLSVGHHIEVSQLSLPDGIECLTSADSTVVTMNYVREPDLEVPNEVEAETGVLGAEGAPSAPPGASGAGGILPSGQGVASEDGK